MRKVLFHSAYTLQHLSNRSELKPAGSHHHHFQYHGRDPAVPLLKRDATTPVEILHISYACVSISAYFLYEIHGHRSHRSHRPPRTGFESLRSVLWTDVAMYKSQVVQVGNRLRGNHRHLLSMRRKASKSMKTPRFIFILPIKTEYVGLCWGQQQSVQNARAFLCPATETFPGSLQNGIPVDPRSESCYLRTLR